MYVNLIGWCLMLLFFFLNFKTDLDQSKTMQYNFVGRILGPRGNSLKRVEAITECRVYIRGQGSVKDSIKVLVPFILLTR